MDGCLHQSSLPPEQNKFHVGNGADGKHYWLTPPALYAGLDAEFKFDFDPCPYPLPEGFDGLTSEWGASNYVNPPFGSILHQGKKKGPTAWVRKAIIEWQKGKRVVLVYPVDKWVLMVLKAALGDDVQVRNLGDVKWHAIEDGSEGSGTGRHIACFILEPKKQNRRGHEAARATKAERGLNQYPTPPEAVLALMAHEPLPGRLWEPACGEGQIVDVLRQQRRCVVASDIEEQGCQGASVCDFLKDVPEPQPDVEAVITNPPFDQLPHGWVERSLSFAPDVYLLARLQFLEGGSDWRHHVLEKSGLRRIYVFRERLPMMHRRGYTGPRSTSRMAFAWFCWRRGWTGLTSVKRISWRDPGPPLPPKGEAKPKAYCKRTIDMFPEGDRP